LTDLSRICSKSERTERLIRRRRGNQDETAKRRTEGTSCQYHNCPLLIGTIKPRELSAAGWKWLNQHNSRSDRFEMKG
jgi:hypothetical protein